MQLAPCAPPVSRRQPVEFRSLLESETPLKKSRFTESQIVAVLEEGEVGISAAELCRKHGISSSTYNQWKSKYSGVQVSVRAAVPARGRRAVGAVEALDHTRRSDRRPIAGGVLQDIRSQLWHLNTMPRFIDALSVGGSRSALRSYAPASTSLHRPMALDQYCRAARPILGEAKPPPHRQRRE
ncbi:hypothetical protein CEY11_06465 [Candidimonas nitroreducens]|uniref:Transposase n=1 Tax=Candidimonas nitroreducens TaxID=683354 RepID=A0A225MWI5_9BURK|nr:hypothetical protein CEY11_06465 [Candidimonas nitroreducens]